MIQKPQQRRRTAQSTAPPFSRHALQRWDTMTPYNSISPERAWQHAVVVPWWLRDYLTDKFGRTPDDVRTYTQSAFTPSGPFQVVFIYRDGKIRDVRNVEDLKHRAAQAAFRELRRYDSSP